MLRVCNLYHLTDYVGVVSCDVVIFMQILGKVIEVWLAIEAGYKPISWALTMTRKLISALAALLG